MCTINHSRFKAGNQLLFQDLFYCTNKHLGDQTRQDRRGRPRTCANKRCQNRKCATDFFFSPVFSQRAFRLLQLLLYNDRLTSGINMNSMDSLFDMAVKSDIFKSNKHERFSRLRTFAILLTNHESDMLKCEGR